jgi:lactate permease
MYQQDLTPTGSLWLSGVIALLPLLTLLVLLGGFRVKAQWASLTSLVVALVIAIGVYGMPLGQALDAGLLGVATGAFIILWITFNAIWIYTMTVKTGHFAVLRRNFAGVSDDQRIQAIVIAFAFGALIEALAGGGSPVAICAVMLIALGFNPLKAAAIALVADTAPVAFGGMANPIIVLGRVTGLPEQDLAAMTGRQTPFLALLVPFVLLLIVDGRRGIRQAWPAALAAGSSFAVVQFLVSNTASFRLTDIAAAVVAAGAVVLLLRVWQPSEPLLLGGVPSKHPVIAGGAVEDKAFERKVGSPEGDSRRDVLLAWAPYAIIVAVFSIAQIGPVKEFLTSDAVVYTFKWPGLDVLTPSGKPANTTFIFNWLGATGTLLFISGVLTMLVLRLSVREAVSAYAETLRRFGWAIFTILCVLALAYVLNLSGQTQTLGLWLAGTGAFFAFLSPVVGWFGVAITGTDAGSNALFGALQVTAADKSGLSPVLLAAANSSGGVMAKMISPQSLAIATAAVGLVGEEGTLFRRIFLWSAGLLLLLCVLVYLQSTAVLGWMVP